MVIAVFYGGRSCEHDVSVVTGVQAIKLISGHEVVPIYIDHDGKWYYVKNYDDFSGYKTGGFKGKPVYVKPSDKWLYFAKGKKLKKIDVALLCNHGAGGEDGSLQGLLQISGIAYTGSGVAGSALGMDKRLSKKIFMASGLKITEYMEAERFEYEYNLRKVIERACELGFPLIVKPSSLGSSIGISVVSDVKKLITALNVAFEWDNSVVIERALTDFIELNCAVCGSGEEFAVSEVEKPLSSDVFLSYADKYERGGFKGGGGGRCFPADIDEKLRAEVRLMAVKAFRSINACGIARVDFLYDNNNKILFVNEINTIPGSLALYLFPEKMTFLSLETLEKEYKNSNENFEENIEQPTPTKKSKKSGVKMPVEPKDTKKSSAKYGEGNMLALEELIRLALAEQENRDNLRYKYSSPTLHQK